MYVFDTGAEVICNLLHTKVESVFGDKGAFENSKITYDGTPGEPRFVLAKAIAVVVWQQIHSNMLLWVPAFYVEGVALPVNPWQYTIKMVPDVLNCLRAIGDDDEVAVDGIFGRFNCFHMPIIRYIVPFHI